eukprot:SAG11_NODE_37736_length_255_cov_1.000000_1_plen_52_part_01
MIYNFVGGAAESSYPPARSPVVAACKAMAGSASVRPDTAVSAREAWFLLKCI